MLRRPFYDTVPRTAGGALPRPFWRFIAAFCAVEQCLLFHGLVPSLVIPKSDSYDTDKKPDAMAAARRIWYAFSFKSAFSG